MEGALQLAVSNRLPRYTGRFQSSLRLCRLPIRDRRNRALLGGGKQKIKPERVSPAPANAKKPRFSCVTCESMPRLEVLAKRLLSRMQQIYRMWNRADLTVSLVPAAHNGARPNFMTCQVQQS